MDVPLWGWALTVAVIVAMLAFDFVGHVRTPHAPSLREAATWSALHIGIAVVFGLLIFWFYGAEFGGEYFAGYVTEKSLSIDNLFVFVPIMNSFAVPRELQQKVLLFGIAFALALRTVFIFLGATVIERSLTVILVTLAVTTAASLARNRRDRLRSRTAASGPAVPEAGRGGATRVARADRSVSRRPHRAGVTCRPRSGRLTTLGTHRLVEGAPCSDPCS